MKFLLSKDKINSYSFTKSLSENYIANNHGNIPTVIVRPSCVTPSKAEPVKGWIDNWYGVTHQLIHISTGYNRIVYGKGNLAADIIPADYVTNMSVVAAARAKESRDIQVFNCTTSSENPVFWSEIHKYFNEETVRLGKNELPYPKAVHINSKPIVTIGTFLFLKTPAFIADLWLKLSGREPKYVKHISVVIKARDLTEFFTSNSWAMRADQGRKLFLSLSPEDRRMFPCDPSQIEWPEYIREYCKGVFKYLKPKSVR